MNTIPLPVVKIQSSVPHELLQSLAERSGFYSNMRSVFHAMQLDENRWIGVAGDGGNASYEWFVFRDGILKTSDCGYGDSAIAFRDVMVKEVR